MEKKEYLELVKETAPHSKYWRNMLMAFLFGGTICVLGQGVFDFVEKVLKVSDIDKVGAYTSMIMIMIGSLLTGIGVYDKLGAIAGAGTIIPITGFANSIVSPSMEFNSDGIIFGVMAKIFTIAGPIIVSGVSASMLIGLIYLIFGVY